MSFKTVQTLIKFVKCLKSKNKKKSTKPKSQTNLQLSFKDSTFFNVGTLLFIPI